MSRLEDLEAEWDAVLSGSLEPDPVKIAKAESDFSSETSGEQHGSSELANRGGETLI